MIVTQSYFSGGAAGREIKNNWYKKLIKYGKNNLIP